MAAESVSTAPGKVILFGEHFVVHGARAVLCAIDRRVSVTARIMDLPVLSVRSGFGSADYPLDAAPGSVDTWVRPFRHMVGRVNLGDSGVLISIDSNIPSGAGLGSSSACCVAAAGSVMGLDGPRSRGSLLDMAVASERTAYPDSSGADCTVSAYGGVMEYRAGTFRRQDTFPEMTLVVANSRMRHSTAEMVAGVGRLRREGPDAFEDLCRRADDISRQALLSMGTGEIKRIGRLASENQVLLEEIGISNDILRAMIRVADRHSYGSKITGAGGGGCIFAVTDNTNRSATVRALASAGYDTFLVRIDRAGLVSG